MAFRFPRTVKIGGVRLNVGKKGITSASIGSRGGSLTIGRKGIYSNVGLSGTGLSYRNKIAGSGNYSRSNRFTSSSPSSSEPTRSMALKFILDDETGETSWTDANGNPISDELITIARKQNRETILSMLEENCEEFNNKIKTLLKIHLDTPAPDTEILYTPIPFSRDKPVPPDKSKFIAPTPIPPAQLDQNILTKNIGFLGKLRDEKNKRLMDEYELNVAQAERLQQELDNKLAEEQGVYNNQLAYWHEDKEAFEKEQEKLAKFVNIERLVNIEAMQDFLGEHLDSLAWPLETNISFEVDSGAEQIWVDIDLPEIEMMPTKVAKVNKVKLNLSISDLPKSLQQQNYINHVHSIGFRLLGEIFVALPSMKEIVISAYSQRINRKTGHVEDEYLYSAKIQREAWARINFSNLDSINVVDCFEMFDLRRNTSKTGVITPIEPFKR